MKSKIKYMLMMVFSFLFFFSFSTSVSAEDRVNEYETYILKYDYSVLVNGENDVWTYKNKTYVMDFPSNLNGMEYVTYYINVKNIGSETLSYPFGTYSIKNGVVSETNIRFDSTVSINGITYFVIRNYDVDTIEQFMFSLIDVDFYKSMVNSLNSHLESNFEFAYLETSGALISGYDDVYGFDGLKYTYYTNEGILSYDMYSTGNLENLNEDKGYVFTNTSLTRLSDMYTITDLENARQDGYNEGFSKGESSVDITVDNDTVINLYIKENDLLTKEEGENKYNQGFSDGKQYVYNNLDIDVTVQDYILNNYYTKNEYDINYELGVNVGKEYVYSNIESDPIIKEYVKTEVKETITEKTNIKLVGDGSDTDADLFVKNYDVDYSDTGDFTINVYKGQDTHKIEVVEKVVDNTVVKEIVDKDFVVKLIVICLIIVGLVVVGSLIFLSTPTISKNKIKKGGKKNAFFKY